MAKRRPRRKPVATADLSEIFARASIGDFSRDVRKPSRRKDLTEVHVGVQIMVEVVREKIEELQDVNADLSAVVEGRTKAVQLVLKVTEAANAATSAKDALADAARLVAEHVGWPVGHVYLVDADGLLTSSDIWYLRHPRRHAKFKKLTAGTAFKSGRGLPGRIHASRKPAWTRNVQAGSWFRRKGTGMNVAGAFGFPVMVGDEVAAVLEFYSEEPQPRDRELMEVLGNVGTQLGRVVERNRSEQIIRREVDFSQGIINGSSDGILAFDRDFRYTLWNPAMERITGIGKWEALGRNAFKIFPFLTDSGDDKFFAAALRGESVTAKDRRFVVLDTGRAGFFDAEYSPLKNESGEIMGGLAIVHDVTQRKVAEQVLKEADQAHARLAAIVESTEDAIISVGLEGTIMTWNPGAEQMYGYSASEMIGRSLNESSTDQVGGFADILKRVAEGDAVRDFVTQRQRKDGSLMDVSMTVSPLRNASGEIVGASSIARDITSQQELLRRQREFVSITSHELRTPLTALSGYLSLARGERVDPERRTHFIGRAYEAARRLTELTEDLLQVARLEEERVSFQLRPLRLGSVVEAVVEDLRPNVDAKHLRLTCEVITPKAKIRADKSKLVQVLRNLLDNAIKYTPAKGKIDIVVKGNPKTVGVTIRDSGVGIDPKNLQRIFDKFFREYHEQSIQAGGTGLGLFITRELVNRQGGQLTITGRRNHGTTAIVRFPRHITRRTRRPVG